MIVNANSIVQYVIQIHNSIIKHVSINLKIIIRAKRIIVGILANVLKNNSVTHFGETISVIDIVSLKRTNTTNTASTNCHSIKVRYCYILHAVLLAIMLLLIIIVIYLLSWKILILIIF